LTTPFFTGSAYKGPPDPCKVLETLLGEAGVVENTVSWEDWAADLGYDLDDRRRRGAMSHPGAQRAYAQVVRQTEKLRNLLGDAYDTLVFPKEIEDVQAWCRGAREL